MAAKKIAASTWKPTQNPKDELVDMVDWNLGPDEIRVLLRIARRLLVGKERYGFMKLKADKRDYAKEASEELLDWLVYTEMGLERAEQLKAKKPKVKRASAKVRARAR